MNETAFDRPENDQRKQYPYCEARKFPPRYLEDKEASGEKAEGISKSAAEEKKVKAKNKGEPCKGRGGVGG